MKKLFFILVLAVAAMAWTGLSHHFILFDDSIKIMKKTELRTKNTFVDARGPKALTILTQPDLLNAGIKTKLGRSKGVTISIPVLK